MVPCHIATTTLRNEATGATHSRFLYADDDDACARGVWWFMLLVHPAELRAGLHARKRASRGAAAQRPISLGPSTAENRWT